MLRLRDARLKRGNSPAAFTSFRDGGNEIPMKTHTVYAIFAGAILFACAAIAGAQSGDQINYGKSFDEARTIETTRYRNRMMELDQEMREVEQMAQLHKTDCVTLHRGDSQGTQACVQAVRQEEDSKTLDHQRKVTAETIHHDRIMLALRVYWNGRPN